MFNDSIKMTGVLTIKKMDDKGTVTYETEVPNIVVTAGKEFIASRMVSSTAAVMGYMAIGDDASTGTLGQTSLQNELARVTVTSATAAGSIATFVATFPAGTGTGSIVEAGVFNSPSSSVISFDGDNDVDDGADSITYTAHPFNTGDRVTYTDGGNTGITGLIDGGSYYVIDVDADTIKLATTEANAIAGTAINITGTSGTGHKLAFGTMLCRTTFPVITKSVSESLAISWAVTVG